MTYQLQELLHPLASSLVFVTGSFSAKLPTGRRFGEDLQKQALRQRVEGNSPEVSLIAGTPRWGMVGLLGFLLGQENDRYIKYWLSLPFIKHAKMSYKMSYKML